MGPKKRTKARILRIAVSTVGNPAACRTTYESQEMAIVKSAPLDKRSVTGVKEPGGQARQGCEIEAASWRGCRKMTVLSN